jgi:PilZ domain
MKRRKRKRKPEQDSTSTDQIPVRAETEQSPDQTQVHGETEPPASLELQVELEDFASTDNLRGEKETHANAVVESAAAEEPPPDPAPQAGADRRTHPRYAFTAAAEVVANDSGARLKSRLRDLSQQGCLVDTDSPFALGTATDVRIAKGGESFEARARVVYNQPSKGMGLMFTAVERDQIGTLNRWIAESRETSWLAANRRRSQRVLMKIPVRISSQVGAAAFFEEDTHTLAISAHGALLVVAGPVYRGQRFTLSNIQTKASLECIVAHIDKVPGEQARVGVEFMMPNQTFWRVAFPPKDWTPRHPDAKSR